MNKLVLPGLIDIHVHLRDPGQEYKEDIYTGTTAALAGGFTTILDMPNNKVPITTEDLLNQKIKIAKEKTVCNLGFYFGSLGDNLDQFQKVYKNVFGLKLYLNLTTGNYLVDLKELELIMEKWTAESPILLHAEDNVIEQVTQVAKKLNRRIHFCHISSQDELSLIIKAKEAGINVTCGVTPHHLFLCDEDVKYLKGFGTMKPSLKSKKDQEYLWKNMKYIDVIESDHAPHTIIEKQSDNPQFGVPGLETTLPLLLTAVHDKRLTVDTLIDKCFNNPKAIFKIPTREDDKIEIDLDNEYILENKNLKTKCGWSPFNGWKMKGRVKSVYLSGKMVFNNSEILLNPGSGKIIRREILQ